jgi:2-polyprenyl-3-methyl-5-hydroxy-6-metoxy-1,4-benzoquinol methylase
LFTRLIHKLGLSSTLKKVLPPGSSMVKAGPSYVNCNFCNSDKYTQVYTKVVRCDACGYVFTNPQMSMAHLERYYSDAYIQASVSTPADADDIFKPPYSASLNRKRELGFVMRHKKAGRLLDIGSAWGGLLYLAQKQGFDAYGVEIARPNADFARNKLNLKVRNGQLIDAGFKKDYFDAIIAVHMIEHAPNPREIFREIARILKPDGVFVGIVPNFNSFLLEKLGENWIWLTPDDHYSHFTPEVIKRELEKTGFSCELHSEEGHYGTDAIKKIVTEEQMHELYKQLRGSELIFICKKTAL